MNARRLAPPLFGLTVLVVDDDGSRRQATRAAALRLGLAVECTEDGERAIASLNAHPVDAVLLPWGRSGVDALAVTAAIRSLGGRRGRVPVVLLAAGAGMPDADFLRAADIDACLGGPVLPGQLADAIRDLCSLAAPAGLADAARPGSALRPAVR